MKEKLIIATIEGRIEGIKAYIDIADPTAVETINEAEIELKCLEKLLNKINEI